MKLYSTFKTLLASALVCVLFTEQSLMATQTSPENSTFIQRITQKVKDAAASVQQTVSDAIQTPEFWIISTLIIGSLVVMYSKKNHQPDPHEKNNGLLPEQDPKKAQQVLESLKKSSNKPSSQDDKSECSLCMKEQTEVPLLKIFYHQDKPCFSVACQGCIDDNALKKSTASNDDSSKKSFDIFTTCPNCRTPGENIRTEQLQ